MLTLDFLEMQGHHLTLYLGNVTFQTEKVDALSADQNYALSVWTGVICLLLIMCVRLEQ